MNARREQGSALLAAIFLIVVVAALGVFSMRLGTSQTHAAHVQLLQVRAEIAANNGIEAASNRARFGTCNSSTPLTIDGFAITVTCTGVPTGAPVVYELRSVASSGVYGRPEFVQRTATRKVSNLGVGSW